MRRRLFLLAVLGSLAAAQSAQAASCPAPHWVAAWYAAPSDASTGTDITDIFGPSGEVKTNVNNSSVRAILTPSVGASRVRVHLSNRFGKSSVRFASTTIAKQLQGPAVVASTIKAVTFAGGRSVTVPAGKDVISDPVDLTFNAFDNLAVSTYVSGNVGKPTEHYTARQTSYLTDSGAGDHSSDGRGDAYKNSTTTRPFVAGLDALLPGTYRAVVTFGDSLTDGFQGKPPAGVPETTEGIDANGRWPDVLGRRLRAAKIPLTVANAGISGNRVLRDGPDNPTEPRAAFGPAALKRLDADVLARAGVTMVTLFEGINDLGQDPNATADEVIAGYKTLIDRLHAARLRVLQGTLTPSGGDPNGAYGSAETEAKRQAINKWIRTASPADSVIDFDAVVRDPADPSKVRAEFDGGDHLHMNLAGYKAMGDAIDLSKLAVPAVTRSVTLRVPKRYRAGLSKVVVFLGKKRIASAHRAIVRVKVPLARVRLRMRVRVRGKTVTLRRVLKACA